MTAPDIPQSIQAVLSKLPIETAADFTHAWNQMDHQWLTDMATKATDERSAEALGISVDDLQTLKLFTDERAVHIRDALILNFITAAVLAQSGIEETEADKINKAFFATDYVNRCNNNVVVDAFVKRMAQLGEAFQRKVSQLDLPLGDKDAQN